MPDNGSGSLQQLLDGDQVSSSLSMSYARQYAPERLARNSLINLHAIVCACLLFIAILGLSHIAHAADSKQCHRQKG